MARSTLVARRGLIYDIMALLTQQLHSLTSFTRALPVAAYFITHRVYQRLTTYCHQIVTNNMNVKLSRSSFIHLVMVLLFYILKLRHSLGLNEKFAVRGLLILEVKSLERFSFFFYAPFMRENFAYGRPNISRPMRIVERIPKKSG